jgi:hypothetical protein
VFERIVFNYQFGQTPNQSINSIRATARPIKIGRESAHLIFQNRKRTDVMDATLFISCAARLSPYVFAFAGEDSAEADVRVDHPNRRFHEQSTLVRLCHKPVSVPAPICAHRRPRPFVRAHSAVAIFQHVRMA